MKSVHFLHVIFLYGFIGCGAAAADEAEENHQRALSLMDKQEKSMDRFDKILDRSEAQQDEYQKYLNSLPTSRKASR